MKLLDVYPVFNIHPVRGLGATITAADGKSYLDLYGGHAVISIGHAHPYYVEKLKEQIGRLGFYSNSVENNLQLALAKKLAEASGCNNFNLFLCSSGAEANENALKMASFQTGKSRVIAFKNGFHGRTSAAVAVTDNDKIKAPINKQHQVSILPLGSLELVEAQLKQNDVCAVILECIQGVGGLDEAETKFLKGLEQLCNRHQVMLIADEVQSGFGRTGEFFAFQHHGIQPDIITMAKGMGNGFPVGGVLFNEALKTWHGMLGTTFGGNHLACTASLAVLEILDKENLLQNAVKMERLFRELALELPGDIKVKGRGLMLGLEFSFDVKALRQELVYEHQVLTGSSKNPRVLRILPPLSVTENELRLFFEKLKTALA